MDRPKEILMRILRSSRLCAGTTLPSVSALVTARPHAPADRPVTDTPRRGVPRRGLALSLAAGGCIAWAILLPSCASPHAANAGASHASNAGSHGAADRLRLLAAKEAAQPDQAATLLPPPPGIDAQAVLAFTAPQLAPGQPVTMTLDTYLAEARALSAPTAYGPVPAVAVDAERESSAMKNYAAGRDLLSQGKAKDAIPFLNQATKDSPASPEPWRSLAEANLAEGKRSAAMSALQQAVRRGLSDSTSLRALGRDAMQSARVDDAIWLLVRALDTSKDKSADGEWDRTLTRAFLADALDQAGFAAAATELYAQEFPPLSRELSASAKLRADAAEVIRRRGETLQRAGDLNVKMGRYAPAIELYAKASGEPSLDPGALVSRRVYAALRLGRPASGAVALIDKLQATQGLVEERELALIRYLCGGTKIGPVLSAALDETFAQGSASLSVKSRVVRARAAALDATDRRSILIAHLASDAGDSEAAADLLATFGDRDLGARDEAVVDLIRRNPASADAYATIMLADGRGVFASVDRLATAKEPAPRLLRSYLLIALGDPKNALAALSSNDVSASLRPAWLTARCEIASFGGDYQVSHQALIELQTTKEATRMLLARAHVALQDLAKAKTALGTPADIAALSPADAVVAAGILLRAGDADTAETLLIKLVEADVFDERPAELLINIYGRGEKPDQQKFVASLRRLREAVPSSRVLRWAAANELVQRSQWLQAQSTLLSLAEEDPTSVGLLDLLATAWIRGGPESMTRGEAWLSARLAAAPESIELTAALARVLATNDKPAPAIVLIDARCAKWPIPRLLRIKEAITAETLKDLAKAHELATARLARSPRPADDTLELCEHLLADSKFTQIEPTLREGLPTVLTLLSSQEARLVRIISLIAQRDAEQVAKGALPIAPGLITFATDRGLVLSPSLQEARVVILALAEPPDIAAIAAAFKGAAPDLEHSGPIAQRIAARLAASPKPRAALTFAEIAINLTPEPAPQSLLTAALVIGSVGNADDLRRLLPVLTKDNRAEYLLNQLMTDGKIPMPMPDRRPAQLIYQIASLAASDERFAQAAGMYEYLLKDVDPQHGMAANDYGYQLLEDDTDRPKATKFLQLALILEPEDDNVLDSVGWLRYKQGRFADDKDNGGPDGIGAISLLSKAVKRMGMDTNPTILDHYGDALWMSGKKDEAQAIWRKSLMDTQLIVDTINADARKPPDRVVKKYTGLKSNLQDKLDAAKAGKLPPVAPLWTK